MTSDISLYMLTIYYSLIFLLGNIANIYYIQMIVKILINNQNQSTKQALIFILLLLISDELVIIIIPILILETHSDNWTLGLFVCKLFWTIENSNKLCSRLILMTKALERVLAVRCPYRSDSFKFNLSMSLLIFMTCLLLISIVPIFYYTEIVNMDLDEQFGKLSKNSTINNRCIVDFPEHIFPLYSAYLFTFGYCIPTIVILVSYSLVVEAIFARRDRSNMSPSTINRRSFFQSTLWKVTLLSVICMALYLVCWTPFWITSLFLLILENEQDSEKLMNIFTYVAHPAVYLNSALNWLPYALMNKRLMENYNLTTMSSKRKEFARCFRSTTVRIRNDDENRRKFGLAGMNIRRSKSDDQKRDQDLNVMNETFL